jgi:hypothetical protein
VRLDYLAQWWVGKKAAEIKAGPYVDERDIRKAESKLKELATKRMKKVTKGLKEKEIEYKLQEGLGKQVTGLQISDGDSDLDGDGDHRMQDEN